MYGHDRQAHAWDDAFNPVNIKAKANWRVRLQILGGDVSDFCCRQVRQDEGAIAPKRTLEPLTKSSLYKSNFSNCFQSAGQFLELPGPTLGHVLDTTQPITPRPGVPVLASNRRPPG